MILSSRHQRLFYILGGFALISIALWTFSSSDTPERQLTAPDDDEPQFHPGHDKGASGFYTRTIVMAKMPSDDISWVFRLEGYNTSIYDVADPMALHKVPKNKGHEAMAYLTYIIENYHNLPDVVVFFHPHKSTWHNNILLDLDSEKTIRRLNPAHVMRQGYFNSRCHHDPGCPNWLHLDRPEAEYDNVKKKEEKYFKTDVWRELHPFDPIPKAISQPCCAQFAVSGERIRARPLSEYEHYRQWLLGTSIEDEMSGRIFEYSWQYIFTGEPEFCPPQHKCYCDGYGICFGGTTDANLQEWLDVLRERELLDERLDDLRKESVPDSKAIIEAEMLKAAKVKTIEQLKNEAYERGKDPKERALECERPWKEGDGF